MYALHITNKNYSSWSLRPWVLLHELGIPFEERLHPLGANFHAFSPTGRVPCLVDGATVVWDSLAIVEYLAERHPGVWPSDSVARAWARSATAEMHSSFAALRQQCSMSCGVRVRLHEPHDAGLDGDLTRLSALWTEGLTRFGGPFLTGASFTAVDAFFTSVAFRVQTYGLVLPAADYARRLLALGSMTRWYTDALAEPWRDAPHDAECAAFGTVTHDLRATPPVGS